MYFNVYVLLYKRSLLFGSTNSIIMYIRHATQTHSVASKKKIGIH